MIYVTHDQIEAMTLADKIVVLRDGRIEQVGTPRELYTNPRNVFVAQFIGSPKMNVLPAERVAIGQVPAEAASMAHLRMVSPKSAVLTGTVAISEYTGSASLLHIDIAGGERCLVLVEDVALPEVGAEIGSASRRSTCTSSTRLVWPLRPRHGIEGRMAGGLILLWSET